MTFLINCETQGFYWSVFLLAINVGQSLVLMRLNLCDTF